MRYWKLAKKINYNNSTYQYITPGIRPTNFIEFRGPLRLLKEIKNGDMTKPYKRQKKNKKN